jgi:hypothetical protein
MGSKIIYSISFLIIFITFEVLSPLNVQAAETVKLKLNSAGSTSWAIGDIKPGDRGKQTTVLQNSGSASGSIIVWISDILNTEGANPESETGDPAEPGELGNYLFFIILSNKLSTNLVMPTTIENMPQSVSASSYLKITPLNAGETTSIDWQWQLPNEVGNDIQGDRLSFTINYTLVPLSAPSPTDNGGARGTGSSGGEGGAIPKKTLLPPSLPSETPQSDPSSLQDVAPTTSPITITILYPESAQIPASTPVSAPEQTPVVPAFDSQQKSSTGAIDIDLMRYNIFASVSLAGLSALLLFLLRHGGRIS